MGSSRRYVSKSRKPNRGCIIICSTKRKCRSVRSWRRGARSGLSRRRSAKSGSIFSASTASARLSIFWRQF